MKNTILSLSVILILLLFSCNNRPNNPANSNAPADTTTTPDTGYTGIKLFMSGEYKISEVTFENGVRQGLTKTFYKSGRLQRTFWYVNGLRQDSSCWYYEEGQLFRTNPFVNDTVNGIQKQFYRTGQLKAKMGYKNGLRTPFFQEFTREGKLVSGYPEIVVSVKDNYKSGGTYNITLSLSKKTDVRFYRGEFINDVFDTTKVKRIPVEAGKGYLTLRKKKTTQKAYVGVIGEVLTDFGNRILLYKKIELPYNDLD
jgi:hypothetical protein